MFSNLLQTPKGILNSLICVIHSSSNFNSVFHKKVNKNYRCCNSIACQEKGTDWVLRIFTFNNKNRLYLPMISTLQFSERQSSQGVTQLVIKPFEISQTPRIVSLRSRNARFFQTPFYFFYFFFGQHLT